MSHTHKLNHTHFQNMVCAEPNISWNGEWWRAKTWQALRAYLTLQWTTLRQIETIGQNLWIQTKNRIKLAYTATWKSEVFPEILHQNLMKVLHCTAFTHLKVLWKFHWAIVNTFWEIRFLVVRTLIIGKWRKRYEKVDYSLLRQFP